MMELKDKADGVAAQCGTCFVFHLACGLTQNVELT